MLETSYDIDIVAWANEQARLLRAGRFDLLDLEHIAEEIEDVGKSERREIVSRMAVLLAHLLKWQYQPERRGNSWRRTVLAQRKELKVELKRTPSLRHIIDDPEWGEVIWAKAVAQATEETGLEDFPDICPWSAAEILDTDWWPEAGQSPPKA
jgi:hypothetical protein